MPNKNNNNSSNEHDRLQQNIDAKFNLIGEKLLEFTECLTKIDSRIQLYDERVKNLNDKIESFEDFVKESFVQFNKNLSEQAGKISALERFRFTTEAEQVSKNKFHQYMLWLIWGICGAVILVLLEKTTIIPFINYLSN